MIATKRDIRYCSAMKILKCVPNFSEGQDKKKIDAIAAALQNVSGVRLLDICTDADHNRTVFNSIGSPEDIERGAAAACDKALELIDMREQQGVHPRWRRGRCPLHPSQKHRNGRCRGDSRRFGRSFAERNGLPVYFYGEAALVGDRPGAAQGCQGGYGLSKSGERREVGSRCGTSHPQQPSGATAVGARDFLVA